VHGNHVTEVLQVSGETRAEPWGAVNLHRKVVYDRKLDLILAGLKAPAIQPESASIFAGAYVVDGAGINPRVALE
jgi:hypothetical protein